MKRNEGPYYPKSLTYSTKKEDACKDQKNLGIGRDMDEPKIIIRRNF